VTVAKKNEIKISITGDTKGLRDGLGDADNAVEGFGSKFAKWGAGLATAGLAAAAAIGAVAKVAYDLGAQFDDAYDTLRIKTGSTGAALDDLKDDFRAVVSTVPTDFATASQAIAGLNSRLGLTGKPLQQLSRQMLELSRITETDLGSNVEPSPASSGTGPSAPTSSQRRWTSSSARRRRPGLGSIRSPPR